MRIAVIGSGPVGQAAGTLLARAGHEVVLFERTPELGPVGAGLLIQPTGLAALDRLGVRAELDALGHHVERLWGESHKSRCVFDARYERLRSDLYGLGLHRAALSASLDVARASAGVELRPGVEVVRAENRNEQCEIFDSHDASCGVFDLVLACDGARSALRRAHADVRRDREYPWGALWFVAERGEEPRYDGVLSQVYRGTREMIGFLPSGRPAEDAGETISVFWSVRGRDWRDRTITLDAWRQQALALAPFSAGLIDQVRDLNELIYAPYRDVVLRRPYAGRVVFLGDAAHAMSPQLGQGVNLGLMDAAALADAIDAQDSVGDALVEYERTRRRSVRFYQFASRWLTPWFQSDRRLHGKMRDAFFGPLAFIPWIERQSLLSLAGVKTGLISSNELPDIEATE